MGREGQDRLDVFFFFLGIQTFFGLLYFLGSATAQQTTREQSKAKADYAGTANNVRTAKANGGLRQDRKENLPWVKHKRNRIPKKKNKANVR